MLMSGHLVYSLPMTHCGRIGEAYRQLELKADAATLEAARSRDDRKIIGSVEVIRMSGFFEKLPGWPLNFGGWTSVGTARRRVAAAAADKAVSSILLAIDSPGGSVDGLSELGDEVFRARQAKPVLAQVDGLAASAAYYVASQAHTIYAHRMDMIGSIGTYMLMYDFSKALEDQGIEPVLITTGVHKGAGAPGVAVSDEHRAEFQRVVDAYFADFTAVVERGRGAKLSNLQELADGRMFLAQEATASGLIDGISTFEETINGLNLQAARPRLGAAEVGIRIAERVTTAPSTPSTDNKGRTR